MKKFWVILGALAIAIGVVAASPQGSKKRSRSKITMKTVSTICPEVTTSYRFDDVLGHTFVMFVHEKCRGYDGIASVVWGGPVTPAIKKLSEVLVEMFVEPGYPGIMWTARKLKFEQNKFDTEAGTKAVNVTFFELKKKKAKK